MVRTDKPPLDNERKGLFAGMRIALVVAVFVSAFLIIKGPLNAEEAPLEEVLAFKEAAYVGSEDCQDCHEKEHLEFIKSTHARVSFTHENVEVEGCEMCHGPASRHLEVDIDDVKMKRATIINPRKNPSTCFSCHSDKELEFRLPYHHPVLEGEMGCNDCHDPHGVEVKPWSSTSLEGPNEACYHCHKDKEGPFVFQHEAMDETCVTCHKVHGSIHDKMLIYRDSNLCLRCHTQTNFPSIGNSGHSSRLDRATCFSAGCHTAVHGSNFDDHLRY